MLNHVVSTKPTICKFIKIRTGCVKPTAVRKQNYCPLLFRTSLRQVLNLYVEAVSKFSVSKSSCELWFNINNNFKHKFTFYSREYRWWEGGWAIRDLKDVQKMSLPSINGTLTGTSQNINKMNIVTLKSNVDHKHSYQDSPWLTLNRPMRTSSYEPIMGVFRHLWTTLSSMFLPFMDLFVSL